MPASDARAHMGGPVPKFKDFHIWKALYCLNSGTPIGRKNLAHQIGVGEGSTRTILAILQEAGLISIKKNGVTLTPEGRNAWNSVAMKVAPVDVGTLTIGRYDFAVQVPHASQKVRFGCEERDSAIISGASGATTLIYSHDTLMFPGNDYPLDSRCDKALRRAFDLHEEDAIVIGTADTPEAAEEGAVTAGIELLGGLRFTRGKDEQAEPLSTTNEIVALAFMVHDLVGGLPVCAKSRDNLGIRIEGGKVIDNAYTGAVLEEVLKVGTTIRRIATSGPYKGIRVIVTPLEMNNKVVAAIGVVDVRTMAGIDNLIRAHEDEDLRDETPIRWTIVINMAQDGPEVPLKIISGLRGVVHAFYLSKDVLEEMRVEESKVKAVENKIAVDNRGFKEALKREHVIAIIKDPRFRPPPEPTVELMTGDDKVIGVEVFPFTAKQYLNRDDVVWLSDAFVMFPTVVGNGGEQFVMPPVSFPELNPTNGCKNVVSCSPAPTCDLLMRKHYDYPDDPKLASVLVAFDDTPVDPDWKPPAKEEPKDKAQRPPKGSRPALHKPFSSFHPAPVKRYIRAHFGF